MTTSANRKRRSSTEVRRLITEAASADFLENGFDRTTIRSVARRAQVTESTVFRHFETKAELFRATAAAPLIAFVEDFARSLDVNPQQDPRDVTLRFAHGLYSLCSTNRQILISLAAGGSGGSSIEGAPLLSPCLQALVDVVHRYMEGTGYEAASDIRTTVRLTVALILGTSLAGKALFPAEIAESEIPPALADFILFGVGYRAEPKS
ncbi:MULTISPECIES: TetR/AcrR family transcriptional regulator [Rhodococcus]|uniref:TetR/AcrR family transcriptional regulator n=1 Tax=Rhodococcus oxybenzonivorans TaxID=1990687 RepID=A0AAE5A6C3_9NOCA|nr:MULTISPECIES: TetR/AcrR family transcriptional regulator [Rhodococcus]MDV7241854.1 TetR/AcrR family transcriptional regulator [Rhodococcus oxybenzonivorans]MDV7265492.1 TetR/AcrR family transcriptional regulator [Rhodococcus oxybenzonivorans]MDV7273612.1 TetR/AcrR family transcriptional regulator [Rhodococcus oxybenzonivorans]MDV7334136.1 TetR/AcrR family transcriptional regulator [Rhodococcus oxybenzonivorans]MDV7343555.1 TetR/AcrR family transcriptional regulator [Rhodococcus oxybenzonivo